MVVRLTCGGADPSAAWRLHCRVREQMVAWLQELEDGAYLPQHRVSLQHAETARPRPVSMKNDWSQKRGQFASLLYSGTKSGA